MGMGLILQANGAMAAEKLTVLLDWFVNPDHGPLVVAKQKGFFAEAGLDVELVAPADPTQPPKLVAAGKAPLAVSYQPELHLQVDAGLPLVRVATLVNTPLATLIALRDGPVKAVADLKGKTVGYSLPFYEELLLPTMLKAHGLEPGDVKTVAVNFALSQALMTGKVDATIGAFRNFELNQMDIEKHPGHALHPEDNGVPAYDELILVTNPEALEKAPLRPFLAALEKATRYIIDHPEESWRDFIAAHPDLNDDLNRRAWRDTIPHLAPRPAALDADRYDRFGAFLKGRGLVKATPPVATYAVELR
ncbi:MAG: ABC transporter substrate-binding protein [Rhodobacterales bacterium]|nr:ABC transporter substrate-binding protein [Rhodobacterales bacterium]